MTKESTTKAPPPRVLLVDDNAAILARARAILTPACEVVGAEQDGAAGFRAAAVLHPDAIVLDISMPGMTGFELAVKLRDAGSTAALIFLTVHADENFVLAARTVGVNAYVVKPRLVSDLLLAVTEAIGGRGFVSSFR